MKKIVFFCSILTLVQISVAKTVRFSVDMTGQTISANGVHVVGDFQTIAGFSGGDWNASTCLMTAENSSMIYTFVVNLPANRKYEYKFVNGDQFYEAEFVPVKNRVGYDFNDNRWLYLDSLDNDTFETQAILFGGTAPQGKYLLRFSVNMRSETVSSNGVHVGGNFNQNNFATDIMCNLYTDFYDYILFVDTAEYTFKYANGNTISDTETVPTACAMNGNRTINLVSDTVLNTVCYNACEICNNTSVLDISKATVQLNVYPNPALNSIELSYDFREEGDKIIIADLIGKEVLVQNVKSNIEILDISLLKQGVYIVKVASITGSLRTIRIIKL